MAIKIPSAVIRPGDLRQAAAYAARHMRLYNRRGRAAIQHNQRVRWFALARAWRKVHHAVYLLIAGEGWHTVRNLSGIKNIDEKWIRRWTGK